MIIDSEPMKGPNTTFWPVSRDGTQIGKVTSAVYSLGWNGTSLW
ncbi:hypothetical protein ACOI1H_23370 [Loktanella sp. DJP18]